MTKLGEINNQTEMYNKSEVDGIISSLPTGGDMLKSENLSGLTNYATARSNLGLDTTANQTDSTDKRFMTDAQKTKLDGIDLSTKQNILSEGAFVNGDKTKLDGIQAGAEVNVNADWNSTSGDSQILNKPTIPTNSDYVDKTTNQTIDGVKTFSSSPIVPTPTTDMQVATKKYVDDNAGGRSKQHRITIPGELIADTSNYQGLYFYNDTGATITISNVAIAVGKAAAGSGAACAVNLYKSSGTASNGLNTSAVNLFTTAIDLGTGYTSLTNVPDTATVEAGRWVTLRVTSSAGATNKSSDLQCIITYS